MVFNIPIFGYLSDALADAGYLVVRYDKRGVGQSGGRAESAVLTDYAEDLRFAVKFLSDRKDVDPKRIAVLGHSEGGAVAMIAASKDKRIAALVLAATIGVTGAELNLEQVTHALERRNASEAERRSTLDLQKRIQHAVLTGQGWEQVPLAFRKQAETPWFQSFLAFDPSVVMRDVRQPILIVQGMLDTQVCPSNADRLEAIARNRKNAPPGGMVRSCRDQPSARSRHDGWKTTRRSPTEGEPVPDHYNPGCCRESRRQIAPPLAGSAHPRQEPGDKNQAGHSQRARIDPSDFRMRFRASLLR